MFVSGLGLGLGIGSGCDVGGAQVFGQSWGEGSDMRC